MVESAERATEQILGAAEDIEDAANTLSASLKRDQEKSLALDIQDNVLRIFEACNFQDLTGQRIAKVLTTLKFVEERIAHMIEIWGGIDAFKPYAAAAANDRRNALLHGPKLDDDEGHVTQEDVDAHVRHRLSLAFTPSADATTTRQTNDTSASIATSASTAGSDARSATKASTSGAIACITSHGPAIRPISAP